MTLTDNGERVLPAVRALLLEEGRLFQAAADIGGLVVGSVTIATYPSVAAHWLPEVIRGFWEVYPNIEIRLMEGVRQNLTEWLEEKRADVGFLSYIEPMPYDWVPLAEDRVMAVLPQNHPLAECATFPLQRCGEEPLILPAQGRDEDIVALFKKEGIKPDVRFSTLEYNGTMAMVRAGLGITITNELITREWHHGVAVLPLDPPRQITLGMALPSLNNAAPAVKRFVRFAAARLTRSETL